MKIIHFTEGATDRLNSIPAKNVGFVPLAHGEDTYVTCLHLLPGASVTEPPTSSSCAFMVVSGLTTLTVTATGVPADLSAGMGVVLPKGEGYFLQSPDGAIVITVHAEDLQATAEGISTPQRIMGQTWPGERVIRYPETPILPPNVRYLRPK